MSEPRLIRVWADIKREARCRACRQPIVFRISATSGHYVPFDPQAPSLGITRDPVRGLRFETFSTEFIHMVTCPKRPHTPAARA